MTEWIPVSERLLEEVQELIVYTGESVTTGEWDGYGLGFFYEEYIQFDNVTHWQPLPDPPQDSNAPVQQETAGT